MASEALQELELESMKKNNELLALKIEKQKVAIEMDKLVLEQEKKW